MDGWMDGRTPDEVSLRLCVDGALVLFVRNVFCLLPSVVFYACLVLVPRRLS